MQKTEAEKLMTAYQHGIITLEEMDAKLAELKAEEAAKQE